MLRGVAATAIVQVGFLNHGDAGLVNNISVAGLFCVFGAVVTALWYGGARLWFGNR